MNEKDENVAHAASYQIQKTQKLEPIEQFARGTRYSDRTFLFQFEQHRIQSVDGCAR